MDGLIDISGRDDKMTICILRKQKVPTRKKKLRVVKEESGGRDPGLGYPEELEQWVVPDTRDGRSQPGSANFAIAFRKKKKKTKRWARQN